MTPSTRKEALAIGGKRYFTGVACKQGHVAERRTKTGECLVCRANFLVLWRNKNPEKVKQHNLTQYKKDPQKIVAYVKQWATKNPAKVLANSRAHHAKTKMRYPKWLTAEDKWMIGQAYELAALRTKMFGFSWHVDHVIPLHGKLVSGLHTPHNLRVVPWVENVRKANKFKVT